MSPTRCAGVTPWIARLVLSGLVLLIVYGTWQSLRTPLQPRSPSPAGTNADVDTYRRIAERVRQGDSYYQAAASELAASGFPTRSVFNFRFPTLAWLFAGLPSNRAAQAVLLVLAGLTLALWFATLWERESFGIALAGGALLLGLLAWPALDDAYLVHELWAGVLIALSLVTASRGWFAASLTAGAAALAIRELTLLYVCVALVDAARRGRRRQTLAWATVIGAFAVALVAHAAAMSRLGAAGTGAAGAASWLRFGGWSFVLKTTMMDAWLIAAPPLVAAIVLPLALVGLVGWRRSPGTQVAATVLSYVAVFLIAGQPFNHLWGFVYAGLALVGLAFAPAALRDLWRRAMPSP